MRERLCVARSALPPELAAAAGGGPVVDTAELTPALARAVIAAAPAAAGELVWGDNARVLRAQQARLEGTIRCAYLDPPYNTGRGGPDRQAYRDAWPVEGWLAMMEERLRLLRPCLRADGALAVSIGADSLAELRLLLDGVMGRANRLALVTVKRGSVTGHKAINEGLVPVSEYLLIYARERRAWRAGRVTCERGRDRRYTQIVSGLEGDLAGWTLRPLRAAFAQAIGRDRLPGRLGPALEAELTAFVLDNAERVVRRAQVNRGAVGAAFRAAVERSAAAPDQVQVHRRPRYPDVYLLGGQRLLFYRDKVEVRGGRRITVEKATDLWTDVLPNDLAREGGVRFLKGKKPERLLARVLSLCTEPGDRVLDCFAGSATSLAVAHKMGRRWLGVEIADYFEPVTVGRMKNVLGGEARGVSRRFGWSGGGAFWVRRVAGSVSP